MTTEELQSQINVLLKQLRSLQKELLKSGKGKYIKIDKKDNRKHFKYLGELKPAPKIINDEEIEKKQKQYRKEFSTLTEETHKILNSKKKKGIKVNIYQPNILETVEKILKPIDDCKIEIIDNHKLIIEGNKLSEKYQNFRPSPCLPPGMGVIPPDGWIDIATTFLATWIISHTLSDLDNLLWLKMKSSLLKLYKLLIKTKERKEFAIITSYDLSTIEKPTIIFVLPIGLRLEEVKKAVQEIPRLSKNAISEFKKNKDTAIFEFKYDKIMNGWSINRKKR
ncbi:hypothetical protein KKH63_01045 [Patescibacteria group bacterium]|nr:hypothetical protein [Patescibacteria group bacterium]